MVEPLVGTAPLRENAGLTIPVKFTVLNTQGAFVRDESVQVALVAQDATVLAGPLTSALAPSAGVDIRADAYHANLSTNGVPPGAYRIRVTFDSTALVGEFGLDLTLP